MYRSYQILAEVKATRTGTVLDSLPWNFLNIKIEIQLKPPF
jgi:hypothetical protein